MADAASLALLTQVASQTRRLSFRIWGFGEGPALTGLVACSDLLRDPSYEQTVTDLVEPFLHRPLQLEDHVACAELLVWLAQRRADDRYRKAAGGWAKLVLAAPRRAVGEPQLYRPDLFGLSSVSWVDTMHTHGPGLAACGYPTEAVIVLQESCRSLQDDSGLFCHGYDSAARRTNAVHWGRGCGWALLGLAGIAGYAMDSALTACCQALVAALAGFEEDGRWHTIVDNPATPIEHSVSALVAAGVWQGIWHGVLDPTLHALATRALRAALGAMHDGGLPVSEATPVGDWRTYTSRRTGVFPWGQGPLLLALTARHGHEKKAVQA